VQSSDPSEQPVRDIYVLSPLAVRGLATFARFLDAYNAGTEREVLALIADNVGGNDCDYKSEEAIVFKGKADMAKWLELRIADHDRLLVSQVYNRSGDPNAMGVVWARRSSDYLSTHGFPNGITPKTIAKIVFDARNEHIAGFSNARGSGSSPDCSPSA
jgi:hypothetical protein